MIELLKNIDTEIFLFLNGWGTTWTDYLFYWISNRFVWIPLYVAILYFLIKRWKKQSVWIILCVILSIFLTDQSCNLIKKSVQRPRPSHETELLGQVHLVENPDGTLYKGGAFGFPSSHAANSMVLVWALLFFLKSKRKWPYYLIVFWSLLISYSRIYLGVHYPFDILAGFFIGTFWAILLFYLLSLFLLKRQTDS